MNLICENVINYSVLFGLILVGINIVGSKWLDIMVSKKLKVSFSSVFKKSKL